MLGNAYTWAAFKSSTSIRFRSRGKNMEGVDDALQAYWHTPDQASLISLMKACNSWLKLKKDKKVAGNGKTHFKTRWDKIVGLANAAYAELGAAGARGAGEYERKKQRGMVRNNGQATGKSLDGHYGIERKQWIGGNKSRNPISATTMHEFVDELTNEDTMAYDAKNATEFGGHAVFGKTFSQMDIKDWQTLDRICQDVDRKTKSGRARHVVFLKKAERIQYLANPVPRGLGQGALLCKNDGTPWDTGTWEQPFAMDLYGNLFVGTDTIGDGDNRVNHSSFTAGGMVMCAGTLKISNGILTSFNNNSGHYKPTAQNVYEALMALRDDNIDLLQVKVLITIGVHGWADLSAAEVFNKQGVFLPSHPKYY